MYNLNRVRIPHQKGINILSPENEISEISREFENFTEAFCWYYDNGALKGKLGAIRWTPDGFSEHLNKELNEGGYDRSNNVRNWRAGKTRISERFIGPIQNIYFGAGCPKQRDQLRQIWYIHKTKPDSIAPNIFSIQEDRENYGFSRDVPESNTELFDIAIHAPPQGSTPNSFELLVTLSPGVRRDAEGPLRWKLGLVNFVVHHYSRGCQLEKGSTVKHAAIAREGSAWVVSSPEGKVMRGDLLPGEALARMGHDGRASEMENIIHARCEDVDFDIIIEEGDEKYSEKKRKAIKRFLQICEREGDENNITLGQAGFKWILK